MLSILPPLSGSSAACTSTFTAQLFALRAVFASMRSTSRATIIDSVPKIIESANITCTGILAHESALKGGEIIRLPEWTLR